MSSRDYLKGKRCMIWSFMGNTRMFQALNNHGDRFDTVGIFTFEVDTPARSPRPAPVSAA